MASKVCLVGANRNFDRHHPTHPERSLRKFPLTMHEGMKFGLSDLALVRLMTESALDRPMPSTEGYGAVRIVCRLGWACLVHVHPFWFREGLAGMRNPFKDPAMRRVWDEATAAHAARAGTLFHASGTRNLGNGAGSSFGRGYDGIGTDRWDKASKSTPSYGYWCAGRDVRSAEVQSTTPPP